MRVDKRFIMDSGMTLLPSIVGCGGGAQSNIEELMALAVLLEVSGRTGANKS